MTNDGHAILHALLVGAALCGIAIRKKNPYDSLRDYFTITLLMRAPQIMDAGDVQKMLLAEGERDRHQHAGRIHRVLKIEVSKWAQVIQRAGITT